MNDYPAILAPVNHVEPVPRRIRAFLAGEVILDTMSALYVWEWPNYPQYYVPLADVSLDKLVDEKTIQQSARGPVERHGLKVGDVHRNHAVKILRESSVDRLSNTARCVWSALDAWFEEDERVFLHPRTHCFASDG